jgi:predicted Rossmann-fold nucleotide-binding protein
MGKVKSVAFFGYAGSSEDDPNWNMAYKIAHYVASKNYKVVNGGGPGIMLAATMGAESVDDADTTAVYYRPKMSTMFEGAAADNVADHKMFYSDYVQRTMKLLELGDIFFVFNGATGTFSELGMAWGLARLYYGHHKPLILVGEFWNDIMRVVMKNMRIREEEKKVFEIANTAEDAINIFNELVKEIEGREDKSFEGKEAKYMV